MKQALYMVNTKFQFQMAEGVSRKSGLKSLLAISRQLTFSPIMDVTEWVIEVQTWLQMELIKTKYENKVYETQMPSFVW